MELLAHEAAVHVAHVDHIDVLGLDAGMGDGLAGRLDDQRLAGLAVELAELAVGPTDDAGGHGKLLMVCGRVDTLICGVWASKPGHRRFAHCSPISAAGRVLTEAINRSPFSVNDRYAAAARTPAPP